MDEDAFDTAAFSTDSFEFWLSQLLEKLDLSKQLFVLREPEVITWLRKEINLFVAQTSDAIFARSAEPSPINLRTLNAPIIAEDKHGAVPIGNATTPAIPSTAELAAIFAQAPLITLIANLPDRSITVTTSDQSVSSWRNE